MEKKSNELKLCSEKLELRLFQRIKMNELWGNNYDEIWDSV